MPPKVIESMQYRENRLETFENGSLQSNSKQRRYWTHITPDIVQLVDCGFYFTPTRINNDQITCVCCRKKETNVEGVANIADYHLTNNPSCPLALIISSQINHLSNNTDDYWSYQPSRFSEPLSKESIDMRKKTFGKYWKYDKSKGSSTTSIKLAKAGFYYCPIRYGNDRVQCVYCNCSLDTWLSDDDPIKEHKLNSNGPCYFLEKVTEQRPRSRSNSRSMLESENNKEIVDNRKDELGISKAVKISSNASDNEYLNILSDEYSVANDAEITDESVELSKKTVINDSPKRIVKRSSENNSLYRSLSHERTTISESEHEDSSDGNHEENNSTFNVLIDIVGGRMTRSKHKYPNNRPTAEENKLKSRSLIEEELLMTDKNDKNIKIELDDDEKNGNEDKQQNADEKDTRDSKSCSIGGSIIKDEFNKEGSETKIGSELSKSHSEEVATELSKVNSPKNRKEMNNSDDRTNRVSRNAKIEYFDDDNEDSNIDDKNQLSVNNLSDFDDNSYHESASDSSDSSTHLPRNKSKTVANNDRAYKVPNKEIPNESISTRTRRGNISHRKRKQVVEIDHITEFSHDTSNESIDEDKNPKANTGIGEDNSHETSEDIKYAISEDKEVEVSNRKQQKATTKGKSADKENKKKRTRKQLIDNVSFDDERFDQVLKSPKKTKKLKITDKRYSPSPPIYDLSNQNLGDYREGNIHFLENDIRLPVKSDSLKKPLSETATSTAEQLHAKNIDASHKLNEQNYELHGNFKPKKPSQNKKPTASNKPNNILDMSFGESANDIFVNHSEPFTFDIKNPLSIKSSNNHSRKINNNKNLAVSISDNNEIQPSQRKGKESPVHDILPSDVSVSSDIHNDAVKDKIQLNGTTGTSKITPNISKEMSESLEMKNLSNSDSPKVDQDMEYDEHNEIRSAVNIEVRLPMGLEHDADGGCGSKTDDNVLLSETGIPKDPEISMSTTNKPYNNVDHSLNDPISSAIYKRLKDNSGQKADNIIDSTIHNDEGLAVEEKNKNGNHSSTYISHQSEESVVLFHDARSKEEKVNQEAKESQKDGNDRLNSQSAYAEYIKDMEEISKGLRSSDRFSSPSKMSNKLKQVEDSTIASMKNGDILKDGADTLPRWDKSDPIILPAKFNDTDEKEVMIQYNETPKPLTPLVSPDAFERFSGNFTNLLESSTPEKRNEKTVPKVPGVELSKPPLKWVPVSLSNLLDNLHNMEAAAEYLNKSLNSQYDLHDDYDGELTNFISNMPEDEENMTIQEWVRHNATNCHKLAKQTCNEMIEVYRAEYLRAIKTLEKMPTID